MKILCLANNLVGKEIVGWLMQQPQSEIVGLVVHPIGHQKYAKEIIALSNLTDDKIFFADSLNDPEVLAKIRTIQPDIAISIFFGYILRKDFLDIFPKGCINIHPAYLPYNRGAYPNVWSIIEGTPAGVTLHYIDEKIDQGDIIAQKKVPVSVTDTGYSLYKKLERTSIFLFKKTWPSINSGSVKRKPQCTLEGTFHRVADTRQIDEINLEKTFKAKDLLNILRARTFPSCTGAYIIEKGQKKYIRISFLSDDDCQRS